MGLGIARARYGTANQRVGRDILLRMYCEERIVSQCAKNAAVLLTTTPRRSKVNQNTINVPAKLFQAGDTPG